MARSGMARRVTSARRWGWLLVVSVAVGGVAGPSAADAPDPGPRYHGTVTILADSHHGPQACFVVADSLPPQCGGPDLRNFSWGQVHPETRGGVTWVDAEIVGTFSNNTIPLKEPPGPPVRPAAAPAPAAPAPCPVPAGGWQIVDPSKATQQNLNET